MRANEQTKTEYRHFAHLQGDKVQMKLLSLTYSSSRSSRCQ